MNNESWISPDKVQVCEDRRPTWWMRRCFTLDVMPDSLDVEIVCLGYYELYVNGVRAGDEPLAPSVSKLDKRAFAISHDITAKLRQGVNCIAVWCSSGWYLPNQFKVHEDSTPLLRVRLSVDVQFGNDWLCRESNRWIVNAWAWNRFGGEEVDAMAVLPEWNIAECDPAGWRPVRVVSDPPVEIVKRTCPPNRIGEVYPACTVRKLADGRFEVDFGICLSGWVDIRFRQLAQGQTVTLRFYDLPADNGRDRDHSYGQYSIYRGSGDGADRFENKFNYAGFRYMTIEGLDKPPALDDMKALLVESDMKRTGSFRCSNELFNRIHDMNLQTLRCLNLGGYSVDCPHRERNGYGADGQTALPGYLYLLDSSAFLSKWLVDWCDVYEPDTGRIMLTAPIYHAQHAPAWGGIVAPLAWALYVYYGNRAALELAFPVIDGYLRFLQKGVRDGVLRKELLGSAFHADWVPVDRGMDTKRTPDLLMRELFNSCYLIYLWDLHIKICKVLGKADAAEAESNIAALREGIHREFYRAEDGIYLMPEQVYQAMPLLTGVVPEELLSQIKSKLVSMIEEKGWHMDAGLPGTTLLLDVLAGCGEHEVIKRIYEQETYPGWGYMVACGATAIWEQWNGYWSQIHSCFAGPSSWFYSGLAGIRPDEKHPGFESFILSPAFVSGIDYVEASYDSIRGRIESSWRRKDGRIEWSVTIPCNTTATIFVPVSDPGAVMLDGRPLDKQAQLIRNEKGELQTCFKLEGGSYSVISNQ